MRHPHQGQPDELTDDLDHVVLVLGGVVSEAAPKEGVNEDGRSLSGGVGVGELFQCVLLRSVLSGSQGTRGLIHSDKAVLEADPRDGILVVDHFRHRARHEVRSPVLEASGHGEGMGNRLAQLARFGREDGPVAVANDPPLQFLTTVGLPEVPIESPQSPEDALGLCGSSQVGEDHLSYPHLVSFPEPMAVLRGRGGGELRVGRNVRTDGDHALSEGCNDLEHRGGRALERTREHSPQIP